MFQMGGGIVYSSPLRLIVVMAVLSFATFGFPQSGVQKKILVINGRSGETTVYIIDGQAFIALESIARIGDGTLTAHGNEVTLTFPATHEPVAPHIASGDPGMSADFRTAAIQELSLLKDWQTVIAHAIQRGVPGDGSRLVGLHDRATEGLRLTTVAAANSADQSALRLLSSHFTQVNNWSQKVVQERKAMATGKYSLSPNALHSDSDFQRITSCSKVLGTILADGRYEDNAVCH